MRIIFTIKGLEEAAGGAERVLSQLVPGLMARGHDVRLLTFDRPGATSFYSLPGDLSWQQVGTAPGGSKMTPTRFVRSVRALRKSLQQQNPDVVVGFMHSSYVPLSLALIGSGIPFIASEHSVPEYYKNKKMEYILLILACLRAHKVTALSNTIIARYPRRVSRRMVPVPNPVPSPIRKNDENAKRPCSHYVLTVGRMDEAKDHATLIRAFALVQSKFDDVRLRIVGDGPLAGNLKRLVRDLALEGYVEMPGRLAEVGPEYANAQLFVLPSKYESFGIVATEALSYGLPVIAFADCPGVNEIIEHDVNGLLVQGKPKVYALTEALSDLLSDPKKALRLGAEGPPSVSRFNIHRVLSHWEKLLCSIGRAD